MRSILILAAFLAGCSAAIDDTDPPADDDDTPAWDDDDSVGDDDGADDDDSWETGEPLPVRFSFQVTVGEPGADDDDSAVAPEDSMPRPVDGEFIVQFVLLDGLAPEFELLCQQRLRAQGMARLGDGVQPDCSSCTGRLDFDPSTVLDVSDPSVNPEDCDLAWLSAEGRSLGRALLGEVGAEPGHWRLGDRIVNFGDFLHIALMSEERQIELGFDGSATGQVDLSAAGNAAWLEATLGLDFTHSGFVLAPEDGATLAARSNIVGVANSAPIDSPWSFYWGIGRDPSETPDDGGDMRGTYIGV